MEKWVLVLILKQWMLLGRTKWSYQMAREKVISQRKWFPTRKMCHLDYIMFW